MYLTKTKKKIVKFINQWQKQFILDTNFQNCCVCYDHTNWTADFFFWKLKKHITSGNVANGRYSNIPENRNLSLKYFWSLFYGIFLRFWIFFNFFWNFSFGGWWLYLLFLLGLLVVVCGCLKIIQVNIMGFVSRQATTTCGKSNIQQPKTWTSRHLCLCFSFCPFAFQIISLIMGASYIA